MLDGLKMDDQFNKSADFGIYHDIFIRYFIIGIRKGATHMVIRKEYLSRLLAWKDEQVIKVVTGIRHCGNSTWLSGGPNSYSNRPLLYFSSNFLS